MEHNPKFHHARRTGQRGRRVRRKQPNADFRFQLLIGSLLVGVMVWNATPVINSARTLATTPAADVGRIEASAYYPNCRAARAAGAAPMHRGSPGYRSELDGDDDGIACEPYRGSPGF